MTKALNAVRRKAHQSGKRAINERFLKVHGAPYTSERRNEYASWRECSGCTTFSEWGLEQAPVWRP